MFATGAGFEQPSRPAGSPIIHTGNIAHGVTALVSGSRYGLYLCDTGGSHQQQQMIGEGVGVGAGEDEEGAEVASHEYLAQAVMEQFVFFEAAVPLLEGKSQRLPITSYDFL